MAKRQTIGENPLDGLLTPNTTHNGKPVTNRERTTSVSTQKLKRPKQRITIQLSADVIERAKNAVYWTPGLTLASLAEDAFSKTIDAIEKERKAPFPKRKEELKTGRPIS